MTTDETDPGGTESLAYNAVLVLQALARGAEYGLEVIERTGLSSGTVYPTLRRVEERGLVEAAWEDETGAHDEGRPARRYYGLTPAGEAALAAARQRILARQRDLGLESGGSG